MEEISGYSLVSKRRVEDEEWQRRDEKECFSFTVSPPTHHAVLMRKSDKETLRETLKKKKKDMGESR